MTVKYESLGVGENGSTILSEDGPEFLGHTGSTTNVG